MKILAKVFQEMTLIICEMCQLEDEEFTTSTTPCLRFLRMTSKFRNLL